MARSNQPSRAALFALVVLIAIAVAVFLFYPSPQQRVPQPGPLPTNANLLLGNPSNATAEAGNKDNYLIDKHYFVLSYNSSKGIPNWVSWRLCSEDLGKIERKQIFDPDTALPRGFKQIVSKDYSGSGFDRGHLCPHGDREASAEMSDATFVMTNIIPQAPNVNRGTWEHLESYCRTLSRQNQRLYIIAGPAGAGGTGENGFAQTIGHGRVKVPAECWKIVVVVPESGEDDPGKIGPETRVIAVLMPNDQAISRAWTKYRTTPAVIEGKTGLHFFSNLAPAVADALRNKKDTMPISNRK